MPATYKNLDDYIVTNSNLTRLRNKLAFVRSASPLPRALRKANRKLGSENESENEAETGAKFYTNSKKAYNLDPAPYFDPMEADRQAHIKHLEGAIKFISDQMSQGNAEVDAIYENVKPQTGFQNAVNMATEQTNNQMAASYYYNVPNAERDAQVEAAKAREKAQAVLQTAQANSAVSAEVIKKKAIEDAVKQLKTENPELKDYFVSHNDAPQQKAKQQPQQAQSKAPQLQQQAKQPAQNQQAKNQNAQNNQQAQQPPKNNQQKAQQPAQVQQPQQAQQAKKQAPQQQAQKQAPQQQAQQPNQQQQQSQAQQPAQVQPQQAQQANQNQVQSQDQQAQQPAQVQQPVQANSRRTVVLTSRIGGIGLNTRKIRLLRRRNRLE